MPGRGDCSAAASLALEVAAEVALHPSEGEAVALFATRIVLRSNVIASFSICPVACACHYSCASEFSSPSLRPCTHPAAGRDGNRRPAPSNLSCVAGPWCPRWPAT